MQVNLRLPRQARTVVQEVLQNVLAVIAKGDEVLDWREMTGRYPGVRLKLLEAGDHALSDFDAHIDEVFAFLELA